MLEEGLIISIMGMGTVFIFLCLMIFVMSLMSKIVIELNKIFPETLKTVPQAVKVSDDSEIALAIAIAKNNIR